jgi:hypothetical protein
MAWTLVPQPLGMDEAADADNAIREPVLEPASTTHRPCKGDILQ